MQDREIANGSAPSAGRGVEPGDLRATSPETRKVRSLLTLGSVWLGLSAFLAYAGYFATYSYFAPYDDEGFWLIALRSYHLHGSLYHNTYAQAGPFYYEMWSLVYSVLGLPVDTDSGRLMTLIVWIATSLLVGLAIWMLSQRILLGVLAEVVSFLVLFLLASVAMEPAGMAHLLGAVVLLGIALFVRQRRRVGIVIVGVASTATVLTKVNLGVFVMVGTVAAIAIYWPSKRWVITRRITISLGLLLLPVLLMAQVLNRPWAQSYCLLELIYLVGLIGILVTRKTPVQAFAIREIGLGLAAAVGSAFLIAMGVLINGTSLAQLVNGAIFGPRGLERILHVPLPITGADVMLAGISSALAIVIATYAAKHGRRPPWLDSVGSGYLRFAVGIWILLTVSVGVFPGWSPVGLVLAPTVTIPVPGQSFLLAAPFVWVAALGGEDSDDGAFGFARVAICLIGVLGCLEGFPVAGSQMTWAALTLVPVGVICITDGLSMISPLDRGPRWTMAGVLEVPLGSLVAMVLVLFLVLGNVGQVLAQWRGTYYANEPVRLSGAHRVRLPLSQAEELRQVTAFLKTNCSTFWSLPGLNSFYFFSGEKPPTDLNSSQEWWDVLTLNQQNGIRERLRHTSRLCVIEDVTFFNERYAGMHVVQTPLVRYIERDFVVVKTVGFYQLLVPSTSR